MQSYCDSYRDPSDGLLHWGAERAQPQTQPGNVHPRSRAAGGWGRSKRRRQGQGGFPLTLLLAEGRQVISHRLGLEANKTLPILRVIRYQGCDV